MDLCSFKNCGEQSICILQNEHLCLEHFNVRLAAISENITRLFNSLEKATCGTTLQPELTEKTK